MRASILIPAYKRPNLLKWGLSSIAFQGLDKSEYEVVIVNDGIEDETEAVCRSFNEQLNIKYIFSGHRNKVKEEWRCPGVAFNIAAKASSGSVIFLTGAEIFHITPCIDPMTKAVLFNPKKMVVTNGLDDEGSILKSLNETGYVTEDVINSAPPLVNIHLPFLMAIHRQELFDINGYDEDYPGVGWEDNDMIDRLQRNGNSYMKLEDQKIIHLWHSRAAEHYTPEDKDKWHIRYKQNEAIYHQRRGQIKRNINKEWGVNV